jgi:hypothetical protein
MAKRQLLCDGAPHGEAGHVGARDLERLQQGGGVVGHGGRRQRLAGQWRSSHSAVVEGGEPVTVREPVELRLPRLGRVAEPA